MLTDERLKEIEDLSYAMDVEADYFNSNLMIQGSFAIQVLLDYIKELKAELNKNVS